MHSSAADGTDSVTLQILLLYKHGLVLMQPLYPINIYSS